MAIIQIPVKTDYILIVDDNIPITALFKRILSEEGEIHVVHDGREGLEHVLKQDYDLIITDMNMPVTSGMEFYAQALEKKPELKGRFLFMAGSFNDDRLEYFQKNDIEHIIKPSSAQDIRLFAKRILLLTKTDKEKD